MLKYLLIGVGGFIGANLRYLIQGWAADRWGSSFPYGTLVANVSGSFLLAFFLTLATQRLAVAPEWRLLFGVGLLGGYTTFSAFTTETLNLIDAGSWWMGAANFLGNTALGFLAALLGIVLARLI